MYTKEDIKTHQDMLYHALVKRDKSKDKTEIAKLNVKINKLKSELTYMMKEMD